MKNTVLAVLMIVNSFLFGELYNANPDPNGDPWIVGGVSEPTPEQMGRFNAISKLVLPDTYKDRKDPLPSSIDNSLLPYFRPVFTQKDGSCGQACGVAYNFTYEINFERGTAADLPENQFPTHHTYNFLNDGYDNGSWYFDGWEIIKANGCPDVETYGGMYPLVNRAVTWMNGYEGWDIGMNNRVKELINIQVGTPEGLLTLKQWFIDHADGSANGGVVNFAAGVIFGNYSTGLLPSGTPNAGEYVITFFDSVLNHNMTFTGYNDSIRFDYNNDGRYTNDLDITGDEIVDMKDWEIGGLRMVNSWGTTWADGGKAWVPYRTLALDAADGGIFYSTVSSMRARASYTTSLKLKAYVSHNQRANLKIFAGVSADTSSTVPERTLELPLFVHQGGIWYGLAGDTSELEFGLDITPLLAYVNPDDPAKYFICIKEIDPYNTGEGEIITFSVIDADSNETVSDQSNIYIEDNSTTYASLIRSATFTPPQITTSSLPVAVQNEPFSYTLTAQDGTNPYKWDIIYNYSESENSSDFPEEADSLLVTTDDDDGYGIIDLDFQFPFYGKLYDHVTISTNGSILFADQFEFITTEYNILTYRNITPYAFDLASISEYGEGIFFYKNTEYLEVRWITSAYVDEYANLDFAVKLYSNGNIEFYYGQEMTTDFIWACGISDGNERNSLISEISDTNDPSGLKTRFTTTDFPYGMTLSPDGTFSGTLSTEPDIWSIPFKVTDNIGISYIKQLPFQLIAPMGIPGNISVAASVSSAILTWDAVSGATVYNIYRSNLPYGSYSKIGTSSTPSYEDTGISGSNKYFYYITADNLKK